MCRRIEVIIRRVSRAFFFAGMRSIAILGFRWHAALGVNSLDARHPAEDPFSRVTRRAEQQPGDGLRLSRANLWSVLFCNHFSLHFAPIGVLPGWPREVMRNLLPCSVR